jgi:hypothetical protein
MNRAIRSIPIGDTGSPNVNGNSGSLLTGPMRSNIGHRGHAPRTNCRLTRPYSSHLGRGQVASGHQGVAACQLDERRRHRPSSPLATFGPGPGPGPGAGPGCGFRSLEARAQHLSCPHAHFLVEEQRSTLQPAITTSTPAPLSAWANSAGGSLSVTNMSARSHQRGFTSSVTGSDSSQDRACRLTDGLPGSNARDARAVRLDVDVCDEHV